MAERTGIEWADATWNPWMGCHKVSPGCKNCYMFREMERYGRDPGHPVRTSPHTFRSPLTWKRSGKLIAGSRIFTCSWSDFFIEEADPWREEAWRIIRSTREFVYLILTKRPERIRESLPPGWPEQYPHVWLIVSAETQKEYDRRWPILEGIPATVRGISAEPLLAPIQLYFPMHDYPDWVITGGESGYNPRPMALAWAREIRDECLANKIPFFHKQHGGSRKVDGTWGGRVLDGRTWDEFPRA